MKELLQCLAAVWGPAGREEAVREQLTRLLDGQVESVAADALGNLLCHRGAAAGRKVLLLAYLDAPGGIITDIGAQGLLRFAPAGQWSPATYVGQPARFRSGRTGVIGGHQPPEKEGKAGRFWVDIGATSREEATALVQEGDFFAPGPLPLDLGQRQAGAGIGARAACAALVRLMQGPPPPAVAVHLAFVAQGTVAPRGLAAAAHQVEPHLAVLVTGIPAEDGGEGGVRLGGGPVLVLKDRHWVLRPPGGNLMRSAASAAGVALQEQVLSREGPETGIDRVEASHGGIPTALVGIPVRFAGNPGEIVDLQDLQRTVQLLQALLEQVGQGVA